MWNWLRLEKGSLPLALILLAVGSILLVPMLSSVSSRLLVARRSSFAIASGYTAEAGAEDGIWNLAFDAGWASTQIPNLGDTTSYSLGEPLNGSTISVTVRNAAEVVAADDFESGDWSGNDDSWSNDWSSSGDVAVISGEQPHEGEYQVRIRADGGYIERSADLLDQSDLTLQFYARVKGFESGDEAELRLSSDHVDWAVAKTWNSADDDDAYHLVEIDLSPYAMSDDFWIAFDADMSNGGDKFFIDDLKIVRPAYEITATAGDRTTLAKVAVSWPSSSQHGEVAILSWETISTPGAGDESSDDPGDDCGDDVGSFGETVIAADNFETGGWSGGVGWSSDWSTSGKVDVKSEDPYQGTYHVRIRADTGYITRAVSLSDQSDLRLQFWARAKNFEADDQAELRVSWTGVDWTVVKTWNSGDDTYCFVDIDLSPYPMSEQFWVAFDATMSNPGDKFLMDDLKIVRVD